MLQKLRCSIMAENNSGFEVWLCNKDKKVLKIVIDKDKIIKIIGRHRDNQKYLPMFLQNGNLSLENLQTWFRKRMIPSERENRSYVMENSKDLLNTYRNFFSLSDQYWLKYDKRETWEKLNFFDNPYCEEVGKAFFGIWEVNKEKIRTHAGKGELDRGLDASSLISFSPDLTTNGILIKKWKKEDGISYLYKGAGLQIDQEPLSEVLASMILKQLNLLDIVEYSLVIESMQLCSKCRNFITRDTEFVPASHVMKPFIPNEGEDLMNFFIRSCNELKIKGAEEYIKKMIYCDYVIGNTDRHLGNFGFIRDANTAEIIGFAPLFDSGSAFQLRSNESPAFVYFSEENKKEAIKYVKKNYKKKLPQKLTCSAMEQMIKTYPTLNNDQRDLLIQLIQKSNGRVKKISEKEISPLSK